MLAKLCFAKHEGCLCELKSFCKLQSDALRVVLAKSEGCLDELKSFCSSAELSEGQQCQLFDDSIRKTANFEEGRSGSIGGGRAVCAEPGGDLGGAFA